MPVTPAGFLSEPLHLLRTTLAACPAWQDWVGAADAAEALADVFLLAIPNTKAVAKRTHALIDLGGYKRERQHLTQARPFTETDPHLLRLYLWGMVAADVAAEPDATFDFLNKLGAVWADLEERAGAKGFARITSVDIAELPERLPPKVSGFAGDAFEVVLDVELAKR